jgi:hypothetical protein
MYIKLENGEVSEYDLRNLKKENPSMSFPQVLSPQLLADFNIFECTEEEDPVIDHYWQQVERGDFEKTATGWILRKIVSNRPLEEAQFEVRARRDSLLQSSDWTHVTDSALSDQEKLAWATYRQALRDITSQSSFPYDISWPTKPE